MIIKPNQPVVFNDPQDNCVEEADYVQIVDNTDNTQFQLGLTVCSDQSQLLPDPNFSDATNYVLPSNWSISNNTLILTAGVGSPMLTTYYFPSTSKYYKITIVVDSITSVYGLDVYLGGTFIGKITSEGTHEFYGFPSGSFGFLPLIITPQDVDDEIVISAITAFEVLLNFGVAIYDSDDTYIDSIFYNTDDSYFQVYGDSITITIDWAALSIQDGCYYLCILDPCVNTGGQNYPAQITNGTFTGNANGWTLASSWTYGSNAVSATFSATPSNNWITQQDVFVNTTSSYTVEVILTAHTGNVGVYFGTTLAGTCTGVGTFTFTGVPNSDELQLFIVSGTATVTSVTAVEVATADYECDATSNTFKLSDYSCACPETLLINAVNAEDGLGLNFEGITFSPRIRLQAKLKQAKYEAERVTEENSLGTKKVVYFNRRKQKNLVADLLPEYVHDFLSTLAGYDKWYINGVEYVVDDDEYNVTYDESQDYLGSISLLVSEQTQLVRNVNCSGDEANAIIPQLDCETGQLGKEYLLSEDGSSSKVGLYILLEDGTQIELE